jgi:hypothetical protein
MRTPKNREIKLFEGVHVAVEGEELLLTEPQSFTLRTPQGGILSERHESF